MSEGIAAADLLRPVPGATPDRGYWTSPLGDVFVIRRKGNRHGRSAAHRCLAVASRAATGMDRGRRRRGEFRCDVWLAGVKATVARARLVAWAWHGPQPEGRLVCHVNGIETDDRAENLYYGTPLENNLDTVWHAAGNRGTPRPRDSTRESEPECEYPESVGLDSTSSVSHDYIDDHGIAYEPDPTYGF